MHNTTPTAYGRTTPNAKLNARIAELGFTNATLAAASGVSPVTITSMRNRRRNHCRAVSAAVALALGCTPSDLDLNKGGK